ncbi:electron transport complex subunit RsxG [Neiella marina]|uniref:Ion-translocating oxidoreductase complex subunit G n=1 Tax=Neiella holothuriorum TaxID=2870530 RepID=A0ABS7EEC9_9GAMM|nr:electron transport complex subunit RsxG [Neiella holothuriorum]MBW8190701.1 electron transport complex subunit RsxG [Neiella holothuriorum]
MVNTIGKNGLVLALFALVCTGLVAATFVITAPDIKQAELDNKFKVLNQVIPHQLHDNNLAEHCFMVQDDHLLGGIAPQQAYLATLGDEATAVAIETTAPNGYTGNIDLIVGLNTQGEILGVRVLQHKETPGLGDKIERRKSDWIDSFMGKTVTDRKDPAWAVHKDGGQFDQFTGATITPRAVVSAVKNAVLFYQANADMLLSADANCEDG